MALRSRPGAHHEAVRITTAPQSRRADIAARQKRYLMSMSLRSMCFVGAIIAEGWLRWTLVAGALVLPYIAVVMANAAARTDPGAPLTAASDDVRRLPAGGKP